jgi:hypothetical protein
MLYRGMDRAQLDAAYNNSDAVPTVDATRANWDARSASLRHNRRGFLDLMYGDKPRQRLDLFMADKGRRPKKVSTILIDKSRITRHIIPLLGTRRVKDITLLDINRFIRDVISGKTKADIKTKARSPQLRKRSQ